MICIIFIQYAFCSKIMSFDFTSDLVLSHKDLLKLPARSIFKATRMKMNNPKTPQDGVQAAGNTFFQDIFSVKKVGCAMLP